MYLRNKQNFEEKKIYAEGEKMSFSRIGIGGGILFWDR
jgi:hypothetical protein